MFRRKIADAGKYITTPHGMTSVSPKDIENADAIQKKLKRLLLKQ